VDDEGVRKGELATVAEKNSIFEDVVGEVVSKKQLSAQQQTAIQSVPALPLLDAAMSLDGYL
jgi:hypothetical protein